MFPATPLSTINRGQRHGVLPGVEPLSAPLRLRSKSKRILRAACGVALALACAGAAQPAGATPTRPQRIVSINQCADELLLRLADRDRVASITWLSRDAANSNVAALADGVPVNFGLAEEVMALRPDLVLAGAFSSQTAVAILKRLGVPVVEFDAPRSLAEARAQILKLADAIGEGARGAAMVRDIDAGLAALASRAQGARLRAMVMQPNGFTVDRGSLVEEVMNLAGLENLGSRIDAGSYLSIPLEAVALQRADVMILNGEAYDAPSLATEALNHPVIAALGKRLRVISLPPKLWTCGGPNLVDAARALIDQTRGRDGASR